MQFCPDTALAPNRSRHSVGTSSPQRALSLRAIVAISHVWCSAPAALIIAAAGCAAPEAMSISAQTRPAIVQLSRAPPSSSSSSRTLSRRLLSRCPTERRRNIEVPVLRPLHTLRPLLPVADGRCALRQTSAATAVPLSRHPRRFFSSSIKCSSSVAADDFPEPQPSPSTVSIDPFSWKDTAFNEQKRDELGLRGLLPPAHQSLTTQIERTLHQLRSKKTDLGKYIFLTALRQNNVRLFYATIMQNAEECLPLIYTPVVGEACQKVCKSP